MPSTVINKKILKLINFFLKKKTKKKPKGVAASHPRGGRSHL
jgi:hypothetical protein